MAQWEFKLPDLGEGVVEGEIVKWLVAPGDTVSEDQAVVEVMTDKATVSVPSPKKGKVIQLFGKEGDVAKVHATLLTMEVEGAGAAVAPPSGQSAGSLPASHAGQPAPLQAAHAPHPGAATGATAAHGAVQAAASGQAARRVLATPVTRRMARELGVDLTALAGTGPQGRVMKTDLLAHVEHGASAQPSAHAPAQAKNGHAMLSGGEERIPLRGLRKRIAESMVRSKFTAPHFTFVEECDTKALTALRGRLNDRLKKRGEPTLSYLPFIAKALVSAFRKYPHLNAVMDEEKQELVVKKDVNLGIAAATEQGLTVFIVKGAQHLSLRAIGSEIDRMSKAAREQKLKIDELQGGTFTITSLGKDGGLMATPIIHHPEVAILGVHKIKETPVVKRGADGKPEIAIGERMNLSCSFDHRVIDGHIGAAFLYEVIRALEDPELLLADL